MPTSRRPSERGARTHSVSYKDLSSSDGSGADDDLLPPPPKRLRTSRPTRASTVASLKPVATSLEDTTLQNTFCKSSTRGIPVQLHQRSPAKRVQRRPAIVPRAHQVETDGVIPPWASLPYEILLDVFRFASHPLQLGNLQPSPSVNWLLSAARVCKSFAEPALAVLYESPPLWVIETPHLLLDLLRDDESKHFINYRPKVKRLVLDSRPALSYTTTGRGIFDICALLPFTPQLSSIEICNSLDRPPYRRNTHKGRWSYPISLFETLQAQNTRLESWRWSGDMFSDTMPTIDTIHQMTPFKDLRRLAISQVAIASAGTALARRKKASISAECLSSLSQLEHLSIESCKSDDWALLNHLPTRLISLTIINCSTLNTNMLQAFLNEQGSNIEHLTLNHNRALDLGFLPALKTTCPALATLEMDLTYYSASVFGSTSHQSDAEPLFKQLLLPEDVPTWPSKLVEIKILHMRKWSSDAAITFFESLLASSSSLPLLHSLVLKVMLDISWRERAGFREKWINRLNDAFLRVSSPPSAHLASKRRFREWKETCQELDGRPPTRGNKRFAGNTEERGGTCETVDVIIDNMRPSEVRFKEEDFMDPEVSGDEDWNEQNDQAAPPTYAW